MHDGGRVSCERFLQLLESAFMDVTPFDLIPFTSLRQITQWSGHPRELWNVLPVKAYQAQERSDLFLGSWSFRVPDLLNSVFGYGLLTLLA